MSSSWLQMLPAILVVHQFTDISLPPLPLSSHGHLFVVFFVVVFGFGHAARLVGT